MPSVRKFAFVTVWPDRALVWLTSEASTELLPRVCVGYTTSMPERRVPYHKGNSPLVTKILAKL